ncbi:MAG: cytochrome-c oxidase, cbb3-type subunit III [Alphaproteobacteria bacterium]|nr:cytochrome-c oxidase, cbb3-type subunit III [Alphaproteobacteria bacterium]
MPTKIEKDEISGQQTTGHEWDGIKELDTPMPKWWLYTFYATILFSAVYFVLFPSVPFVNSYFGGILGYNQREDVARRMEEAAAEQAPFMQRVAAATLEEIRGNPELLTYAQIGGRIAFNNNCAPCHQVGGAGARGYPNLADDDWLWGGRLEDIHKTIQYGIRNSDERSRQSAMPRYGADRILDQKQIGEVAEYVLSLSGRAEDAERAARGAQVFAEQCVACHGERGEGNRELGAPDLTNAIWLYGGDRRSIVETIYNARNGAMPAWEGRLDAATIKMLSVYVHALGGGE